MKILSYVGIIISMACLVGCASDGIEPPPPLNLYVSASKELNDGHMVYMLIRNVNEKQFISENYEAVVSKVFPLTEDATLLSYKPIYPGESVKFSIEKPLKGTIGLYFMFTTPGGYWKNLLQMPLDDEYMVSLPSGNNVLIEASPWFYKKWFY
jgi:hypothetical protein